VRETYEQLVALDPDRWVRVDADREADAVHRDVLGVVEGALA
jgi:thymidylate kinase